MGDPVSVLPNWYGCSYGPGRWCHPGGGGSKVPPHNVGAEMTPYPLWGNPDHAI